MDWLNGINSFLVFVNENWTGIMVCAGLLIGVILKVKDYIGKTTSEKIEVAKAHIREYILKLVTDAELDFAEWSKAGSIKRAQVIGEIYADYPILEKVVDQEALIRWIDAEIDKALTTLRDVINNNEDILSTTA